MESEDFPHLVQALDAVLRKLGGTARRWRFGPRPTPTPLPRGWGTTSYSPAETGPAPA